MLIKVNSFNKYSHLQLIAKMLLCSYNTNAVRCNMSYKVYGVTKTQLSHDGYKVKINGESVDVDTARVSTVPFNRRWPGHQRQIEQTELVNFLSMEADEEVELRIIPKMPSLSLRIRPRNLEAQATIDANGVITVRVGKACQFTVEPYGKSRALQSVFAKLHRTSY